MTSDAQETAFTDPRNVTVGKGRVIWAKATMTTGGHRQPEGYVLPGGERTPSRLVAHAMAVEIDRLSA